MGATLKAGETVNHLLSPSSQVYLVAARGSVRVNGELVDTGDGAAIAQAPRLAIEAATEAEVAVVEVQ